VSYRVFEKSTFALTPNPSPKLGSVVFMSRVPPVGEASPTGDIKKRQDRGEPEPEVRAKD
jgi:hypothetical protein